MASAKRNCGSYRGYTANTTNKAWVTRREDCSNGLVYSGISADCHAGNCVSIAFIVLYFVVRRAVRDGIADAMKTKGV